MGVASSAEDTTPTNHGRNKCAMASGSAVPSVKVSVDGKEYWHDYPEHYKQLFDIAAVEVTARPAAVVVKVDDKKEEAKKEEGKAGEEKKEKKDEGKEGKSGEAGAKTEGKKADVVDPAAKKAGAAPPADAAAKAPAKEKRITFANYEAKKDKVASYLPYQLLVAKTTDAKEVGEVKAANEKAADKFKKLFGQDSDGGLTLEQFKNVWVLNYGHLVKKAEETSSSSTTGTTPAVTSTSTSSVSSSSVSSVSSSSSGSSPAKT